MPSLTQPSVQPAAPARAAHTTHTAHALVRWEGHMSDGVGTTYGAEPTAVLEAEAEELLLSGGRGTFRVPRTAITRITRGSFYPWFFGGIRIHHRAPGLPEHLLFKPMTARSREILGQLQSLGYPTG